MPTKSFHLPNSPSVPNSSKVEDLANQVEIKYGCMGGGSTSNFFKVRKNTAGFKF